MPTFAPTAATILALALPAAAAPHSPPATFLEAAATATWRSLDNSRLGCNSPDVFTAAAKQPASERYLMSKLKSGDCRLLPAGKVQVEKSIPAGELPAQACVKTEGRGQCWWVPDEFLQ